MDLSIFVARVVAVIYLAVGLGMLFDKVYYKKFFDNFMKDVTAMYVAGLVALVAGFSLVTFHNDWVKSWEVLVTILGWTALVKGILILAVPSTFFSLTKSMVMSKKLSNYSYIVIVLGLVFGYFGFIV